MGHCHAIRQADGSAYVYTHATVSRQQIGQPVAAKSALVRNNNENLTGSSLTYITLNICSIRF